MRLVRILTVAVILAVSFTGAAIAGACTGNSWQPTFVHDLEKPDGPWYVHSNGRFSKLQLQGGNWIASACKEIGREGLRDSRGFTNCQNYTRVQCGCTRSDQSNTTCRRFLSGH